MNKQDLIEQVLITYNVKEILEKRRKTGGKVTYENLLKAILDSGTSPLVVSLAGQATVSTIANLTKVLFPDKPRTSIHLDTFLLSKIGLKECSNCNGIFGLEFFRKNSCKRDGLNAYCKDCHMVGTAKTQASRQGKYRAAKLNRTPLWANLAKIKEFYDKCPNGFHVDHIVPLQGVLVSGLHVEYNLQYLSASENSSKRNKFEVV